MFSNTYVACVQPIKRLFQILIRIKLELPFWEQLCARQVKHYLTSKINCSVLFISGWYLILIPALQSLNRV